MCASFRFDGKLLDNDCDDTKPFICQRIKSKLLDVRCRLKFIGIWILWFHFIVKIIFYASLYMYIFTYFYTTNFPLKYFLNGKMIHL